MGVDQVKGYLCSMQLGEETAECLFEFLPCVPQTSQIKHKYFQINFCSSLHQNTVQTLRCQQILLLNVKGTYPWEVNGRWLRLTNVLDLVSRLRMGEAIKPRHLYVPIIWTGTAVNSYNYCNVICKITGSHLELSWITMPTDCIYSYNRDRSECNWLIAVRGL